MSRLRQLHREEEPLNSIDDAAPPTGTTATTGAEAPLHPISRATDRPDIHPALWAARAAVEPAHRPSWVHRWDKSGILRDVFNTPRTNAQLTAHIKMPTRGLRVFIDSHHSISNRQTGVAVDLGCSGGRDSRNLAARGYSPVHAIDRDPYVHEALRDVSAEPDSAVVVHSCNLQEVNIANGSVDLVNAQHTFPFCGPSLAATLSHVCGILRSGGVLAASFFGPTQSEFDQMVFDRHDEDAVRKMLGKAGLEVVHVVSFREENHPNSRGTVVPMWDELIVLARRP